MPKSFKERWEGSSFVLVVVLIIGSFAAGIKADDWLKSASNDKQDEGAEPSEDLRKEIEQVRQRNSFLEAELKSRAAISNTSGESAVNYAGLQGRVAKLQEENQRLQRLCGNRSSLAEDLKSKSYPPDIPVRTARFDARLDLGSFCRLRYGMDFIRLQEDKLACEKSGEAQSVKLEEACFWSYGSPRYSVEPVSLNVLCDSSEMSDPPCGSGQRSCGLNTHSCCPAISGETKRSPLQNGGLP